MQHVDSQGSCEVELAFDAFGNPAIAYNYLATLRFARWTGTAWSIQSVENGGFRAGLALDPSSGNPVLVHQVNLSIHVVEWTGTAWSVDSFAGPNGSELPSIGFNASGVLFVSWTWYEVDLSHKTASGWVTEVIDSNTWTNQKTILVMDPNGDPSVSYNGNNASPYPRLARVDAA